MTSADPGRTPAAAPAIRPIDPAADLDWLHALNAACVPAVNDLPPARLAELVERAALARAAWLGDAPAGAMLAFAPEAAYDSLNFQWFRARYDDFLYLDRIMVADWARRRGVGRALYAELFAFAAADPRFAAVTCEVNSRPPNPGSMAFHEGLGFAPVGEQETDGGAKAVVLLRRPV